LIEENQALANNQVWYSNALEVLGPLRWHLNELVEAMESHNRYAKAVDQPLLPERKIEAAKAANEAANKYFSGK
jgi:hypothetical protein